MISRRQFVVNAAVAAVGSSTVTRRLTAASQVNAPVALPLPANACDCHVHVFNPQQFPFAATRAYTPPPALVADLNAKRRAQSTPRVVIVQPSVYGTDHRCLLDALRAIGPTARGVAVIEDSVTDRQLDDFFRAGVRGARLNLETGGVPDIGEIRRRFQSVTSRVSGRGWHVQLFTRPVVIRAIADLIVTSPVPVVIDHIGRPETALGVEQAGFDALVRLVRESQVFVKLSAPYLSSTLGPDYPDLSPLVQALVAANPARLLWGSDWPHVNTAPVAGRSTTDLWPNYQIDDGRLLGLLATWVPDAAVRRRVLVDTPAALYGYS